MEDQCETRYEAGFETGRGSRCRGRCGPPVETRCTGWDGWLQTLGRDRENPGWEVFVRRYGRWLQRRCWYVLLRWGCEPRWDEVEELVQEVYCRLLENRRRRLRSFRGDSEKSLRTFLSRVVRTVVINHVRHRQTSRRCHGLRDPEPLPRWRSEMRMQSLQVDQVPCLSPSPERRVQTRQQRRLFRDRCQKVLGPRTYRRDAEILWLALLEGWSSREIASRVALSPSAVDTVVSRARRRLVAEGLELPERRGGGPDRR